MVRGQILRKTTRHWGPVILAGAAGLAAGIAGLAAFGRDALVRALGELPAPVAGAAICALLALAGVALAASFVIVRLRVHIGLTKSALNNMTQGLCMFDSAARLILCNERFIAMHRMRPEHARAGTPMRDLVAHRVEVGTLMGDPDAYVESRLKQIAEGRAATRMTATTDGRFIAVDCQPMPGGGWVDTHSDITRQLVTEQERDALRDREERRAMIDAQTASFRARVETVLKTVVQNSRLLGCWDVSTERRYGFAQKMLIYAQHHLCKTTALQLSGPPIVHSETLFDFEILLDQLCAKLRGNSADRERHLLFAACGLLVSGHNKLLAAASDHVRRFVVLLAFSRHHMPLFDAVLDIHAYVGGCRLLGVVVALLQIGLGERRHAGMCLQKVANG